MGWAHREANGGLKGGAERSGCEPMGRGQGRSRRAGGGRLRRHRALGKEPVRVLVSEAGGRPGEPRGVPKPPERERGLWQARAATRRRSSRAVCVGPRRTCARPAAGKAASGASTEISGSGRGLPAPDLVGSEGRGVSRGGRCVPMAASCQVCVRAPLGDWGRRPAGGALVSCQVTGARAGGRKSCIWLMILRERGGARGGWEVGWGSLQGLLEGRLLPPLGGWS